MGLGNGGGFRKQNCRLSQILSNASSSIWEGERIHTSKSEQLGRFLLGHWLLAGFLVDIFFFWFLDRKQTNKQKASQRCACAQGALLVSHMAAVTSYTFPCFCIFSFQSYSELWASKAWSSEVTAHINLTRQCETCRNVLAVHSLLKVPSHPSLKPKYKVPPC